MHDIQGVREGDFRGSIAEDVRVVLRGREAYRGGCGGSGDQQELPSALQSSPGRNVRLFASLISCGS